MQLHPRWYLSPLSLTNCPTNFLLLATTQSRRGQDRQSERAKWKQNRKTSGPAKRTKGNHDVNDGWPRKAHYAAPTGRNISLKQQPKQLQGIIKRAMEQAEGDILFVNAFPSGADQDSYICDLLKRFADEDKNKVLASRIKTDPSFSSALAPLVSICFHS